MVIAGMTSMWRSGHRAHPLIIVLAIMIVIGLLYPLQVAEVSQSVSQSVFRCPSVAESSANTSVDSLNNTISGETELSEIEGVEVKEESEMKLGGGIMRYTRSWPDRKPELIWLILTYNDESWGRDGKEKPLRTLKDHLKLIKAQYPISDMSIGLLTSSTKEYTTYKNTVKDWDFARVTIFFVPESGINNGVNRDNRHDGDVQKNRRIEIAKLRNYLMLRAVQDEKHIIWTDADISNFDKGIVDRMISHTDAREDVGIITARCSIGATENYDWNAWQGTRQGPRGWDLDQAEIDAGEEAKQGQKKADHLLPGTNDDDLIPLDTVGATILYIRASLVWLGVNFSTFYVVGTRWGKDGWDGIESEGMCYMARNLPGGSCMLMGGNWHVAHATD